MKTYSVNVCVCVSAPNVNTLIWEKERLSHTWNEQKSSLEYMCIWREDGIRRKHTSSVRLCVLLCTVCCRQHRAYWNMQLYFQFSRTILSTSSEVSEENSMWMWKRHTTFQWNEEGMCRLQVACTESEKLRSGQNKLP